MTTEQKLIDSVLRAAALFRKHMTQSHRAILFQQVDALEKHRREISTPSEESARPA